MPEFDKDVFELMIEKVIIGEKEENGNINPSIVTLILLFSTLLVLFFPFLSSQN